VGPLAVCISRANVATLLKATLESVVVEREAYRGGTTPLLGQGYDNHVARVPPSKRVRASSAALAKKKKTSEAKDHRPPLGGRANLRMVVSLARHSDPLGEELTTTWLASSWPVLCFGIADVIASGSEIRLRIPTRVNSSSSIRATQFYSLSTSLFPISSCVPLVYQGFDHREPVLTTFSPMKSPLNRFFPKVCTWVNLSESWVRAF